MANIQANALTGKVRGKVLGKKEVRLAECQMSCAFTAEMIISGY
jgi:hypothetical protein